MKERVQTEQAPSGWYPDGQGNERLWDGVTWTDQIRSLAATEAPKKPGAFSKIGAAVKNAAAERRAAKEELDRRRAEDARAAGAMVTSGVFGTSTVEIYENGFVRVASWPEGASSAGPKPVDDTTPYEKLRSITFTPPAEQVTGGPSILDGAVGPTVAKLMKGGKGLVKASAPGMAVAGFAHLAANAARKSYLTLTTDKQIHTLTNQTNNTVGLKTSNKGHDGVARALEAAGNEVLGIFDVRPELAASIPALNPDSAPPPANQRTSEPSLASRLRELAELHKEGILSEDEFASAKAKLLDGL